MEKDRVILLFDGDCILCNRAVHFVLSRDPKGRIKICSLQSEKGKEIQHALPPSFQKTDSMLLVVNNKAYQGSDAALRMCAFMRHGWPLMQLFLFIPAFIRNAVYRLVANNRYRWFGKTENCKLLPPELRDRFIL